MIYRGNRIVGKAQGCCCGVVVVCFLIFLDLQCSFLLGLAVNNNNELLARVGARREETFWKTN